MLKANTGPNLYLIDIFQYVTQNSTFTRQNALFIIHELTLMYL